MPREDAELLARASRGDHSAFGGLYNRYQTDLYRFVLYLSGNRDEAEELFQETWLRVVRSLGRKPVENFKSWLFCIAANVHRDELRKKKVRRLFLGSERTAASPERATGESGAAAPDAGDFEIREALVKAMKNLTHRQRTVFVLTYVEGFKIREVCEMLGKAEGTVKSTLHRAVHILREGLEDFRQSDQP